MQAHIVVKRHRTTDRLELRRLGGRWFIGNAPLGARLRNAHRLGL